jgi:hypothetical protein
MQRTLVETSNTYSPLIRSSLSDDGARCRPEISIIDVTSYDSRFTGAQHLKVIRIVSYKETSTVGSYSHGGFKSNLKRINTKDTH